MTPKSASGDHPMYLSRKTREAAAHASVERADIADDALAEVYEHEYREKLDKMGTITHEVEQVTKMVKALRSSSNTEKQLTLEKLIGILDALNSLRYNQRELIKKSDETASGMENGKELQAEIISKLIDSLAAELGQLGNQSARREALIQQISDLSRLYADLKNGDDSVFENR